jgi:GTP-binding protein
VTAVLSASNVKQVMSSQSKQLSSSYEVAIVGRSNVGKSSLINSLLNEKVAIPSKMPGKTQQLIFHTLNSPPPFNISLVDAPGYGYAEAPEKEMEKWRVLADQYFTHATFLKNTVVLIDCRRGIIKSDEILLEFLNEHRRHNTIVLTKCDCLKLKELNDVMMKVAHLAAGYPRTFGTIFATSSKLGFGIKELRMFIMFAVTNPELFSKASK